MVALAGQNSPAGSIGVRIGCLKGFSFCHFALEASASRFCSSLW